MNKYYVAKLGGEAEELDGEEFFVLRRQDVFGAQALWAYAHLLQSATELDTLHGFLTPEVRHRLETQADEVAGIAMKWQRATKKLPD